MNDKNRLTFISTLALAAATPAFAQAESAPSADDIRGDAIVVTGSRAVDDIQADALGASLTILDSDALERRQTRVVSDILRDVPGVAVSRSGAVGGLTAVRIRGAEGNHTLVLIDGIEASDPYQGEFDFGGLIADDVARIEVLRGQQSAIYGSDAIAGVVHYITASGAERPGFSGRMEYGSDDTFSAAARAAGVSGGFDYAVSAAYNRTDGYPVAIGGVRDIGAESVVASGKFNLAVTDNFRLRAVARYSRTEADLLGFDFDTFAPSDGTESFRQRSFMGLLRAELDLMEGRWSHAVTAQINDARRITFDRAAGNARTNANEGQRLKASYETSLRLGEDSALHTLTFASDFEREEFRHLPPTTNVPLATRRRVDNVGLVGEYRFSAGDWLSIGGAVRHDDNDGFGNETTYRLSGSVKASDGVRLHAAYGTGIKNPTPIELFGFSNSFVGNPDLVAEKSRGWEAGIDFIMPGDQVRFGATYFKARLRNEISTSFDFETGISTPFNLATHSTQSGIELSLAARIGDTLRIDAAYTYLDAKENGIREIRRAPNIASLNVDWQAAEPLSLTATVRYNGAAYDNNFTLLPGGPRPLLGAYTLVNFAADWAITPQVHLFGRVENAFDADYTEVFAYRTRGRTASVGVRAAF